MLITVSGLDGAGKSTLIAALARDLEREGHGATVLHLNDHIGVYAWLRALRKWMRGRPAEVPPRFEPSATLRGRVRDRVLWSKLIRRIVYPLDLLVFQLVRFYVTRVQGRVLIMDRYFYDRLVDIVPTSTRKISWAWVRLLARLTPVPELAVLLEVTPDEAFARKREYSVPYLTHRAAAYGWVFDWLPHALHVRAEHPDTARNIVRGAAERRVTSRDAQMRTAALSLLLGSDRVDPDEIDWADLRPVAERGGVIVRLADALVARGEELPQQFAVAASQACQRTQRVLEVVDRLAARCNRLGIPHAFLKMADQYPDSGRDIDLLVAATSPEVDRAILAELPASAGASPWRGRLAGSRIYTAAYGIVIDIQHGRLGQFGEQARFARLLVERAGIVPVGPTAFRAPSVADHFLLLATQRMYTRPALRLADVYGAIAMLRQPDALNWDYVFATALAMGMVPAVGAYLDYVNRMHARLFTRALVSDDVLDRFQLPLPIRERGVVGERDGRYPRPAIARQIFMRQIQSTLEAGRWHSAARLSLLPLIAGVSLARRGSTA